MDKKTKFRMASKIGILLVFIGFFLPVSCNQNGLQLAKALETIGGPNLLSVSLYLIFLASCAGIILFIFLLQKIAYGIKYDWFNLIAIILPFSVVVIAQIKEQHNSLFGYFTQFQSGAYIMFIGLVVSFIALLCTPKTGNETQTVAVALVPPESSAEADKNQKPVNTPVYDPYKIKMENKRMLEHARTVKRILSLADGKQKYTLKEILIKTNTEAAAAETILANLINAGYATQEAGSDGKTVYVLNIDKASKEVLAFAEQKPCLSIKRIVENTELEAEEAKTAWGKFLAIGLITNILDPFWLYLPFDTTGTDILEKELVFLLENNCDSNAGCMYQIITEYTDGADIYLKKLKYTKVWKKGTDEDWNTALVKLKKLENHELPERLGVLGVVSFIAIMGLGLIILDSYYWVIHVIAFISMFALFAVGAYFFKKDDKKRSEMLNSLENK